MVRATSGSLYNRALVNPDYKDFGPRLGLGLQRRSQDRDPRRIRHQLRLLQPRREARIEGINAPQALFGVFTQTIPQGGPVPPAFLTTSEQLHHRHRESGELQSADLQRRLHPGQSPWPYIQNWFLSVQREITKDTVLELAYNGNHSLRLPIIADYNQATPNAPGGTLDLSAARVRYRASGRSPGWIRPATITTTAFRPAWSIASATACTS